MKVFPRIMFKKLCLFKSKKLITRPGFLNGEVVAVVKVVAERDYKTVRWDVCLKEWVPAPDLHFADVSFKPILNGDVLTKEELHSLGIAD